MLPQIEWLPSLRQLKRLDFVLRAQTAARRFGADLVYTWLPQSAALGLWHGYPVVLEMHADAAGRMGPWWLRQFWRARGRKAMTVTTRALRTALERSTGLKFPDEQVIIAPNGVELERYDGLPSPQEARRKLGLPEGPTAGFTGHIYPGRGADLLFELARQLPGVNFLWVGGTPELVASWRGKLEEADTLIRQAIALDRQIFADRHGVNSKQEIPLFCPCRKPRCRGRPLAERDDNRGFSHA